MGTFKRVDNLLNMLINFIYKKDIIIILNNSNILELYYTKFKCLFKICIELANLKP